ncbi:NmrA family NAD(P)-binding protein [Subtercola lobariae]|uniref:NmrA family transcriptional regulator n=1 Tax=Subtercola lobariae TaxID=1588641 RepID=A0A917EYM5_9MICO|nr:NAD(P)H-binding protein [Subtercola lobariae]GGF34556.1 NmrA family transcriptional regulator [Subtercola lobariae]
MIVITGATGALNGATVDHLLDRLPASELVVVARDVSTAQRFADLGVAVRHGDFADPSTLPAAFDGADQLLLVSSSDPAGDATSLHRAAVDAAISAGVGRILYTSHQGTSPDTPFGPGRDHAATERMLADSGISWTSLRNGFYSHSLGWMIGPWRETGTFAIPADGPVSWTSRADEAEAAAIIIAAINADPALSSYDGPVTLTASAAPTFAEVAEIASEATGRTVTRVVMEPDEWVAAQIAAGRPEFVARFSLGMYQAADQGYFEGTDPLLATLLGREPLTVRAELSAPPIAH